MVVEDVLEGVVIRPALCYFLLVFVNNFLEILFPLGDEVSLLGDFYLLKEN